MRREGFELRDEAGVGGREEGGVRKLLRLVRQADEVGGDGGTGLVGMEGRLDLVWGVGESLPEALEGCGGCGCGGGN